MKYLILILSFLLSTNLFAANKIKLGLNWKPEPQFGGFYEAQRSDLFKKNNLEVEILPGGSGTPTVQMLSSGQLDYAVVSADEILIAREKGSLLVAIFAVYQTNPQAIMTHTENNFSDIFSVFKSEGTIALQSGLPYVRFIQNKVGKDLKAKLVPYNGGVSLFLQDKNYSQQCFYTSEPILIEKEGGKHKTFLIADSGYNPYTTIVAVKKSLLDNNPKQVKAMVDTLRASWGAYLKLPAETNKLMNGLNPSMDLATFARSAELQKPLIETEETKVKGLGSMNLQRWEDLKKQMAELKLIKTTKADTKSIFVNL